MRRLLEIITVIALLELGGSVAFADDPTISLQPEVGSDSEGSTAGGSAAATGGDIGPATVASNEPITASSSTSTAPSGAAGGSTSASGPGTTATAPANASPSQPNTTAPGPAVPSAPTTGPTANADASQSSVSLSDPRIRARTQATATGAFAGTASGVGSFKDPTYASTCSTAEAEPGLPTDASVGTTCGSGPSTASENFSVSGADGNGAAGAPSGSACLFAGTSAGVPASGEISTACTDSAAATPSTFTAPSDAGANGTSPGGASCLDGSAVVGTSPEANLSSPCSGPAEAGSAGAPERQAASDDRDERSNANASVVSQNGVARGDASTSSESDVLGVLSLPGTATEAASIGFLGAGLIVAGVVLLRKQRRP